MSRECTDCETYHRGEEGELDPSEEFFIETLRNSRLRMEKQRSEEV